jgi:hypothetical protein
MDCYERKIAEDEAKIFAKSSLDLLNKRIGLTAVGALVVAVFNERCGGVVGSLNVVSARIWFQTANSMVRLSLCHAAAPSLSSFSNALRIPSAPGLTQQGSSTLTFTESTDCCG